MKLRLTSRPLWSGLALCTALAAAGRTLAQDSVSKVMGLPGDAIDATGASEQFNDYVVDLSPFRSSWNAVYGIAPIAKTSRAISPLPAAPDAFFNNAISASSLSSNVLLGVPFFRPSYMRWSAPGLGVNNDATYNDPGSIVNTAAFVGSQFAFAFSDFNTSGPPTNDSLENNVIGGIVNYRNEAPSRLYVSRITAAANSPDGSCNDAQLGGAAVEANGNVVFRGDASSINNQCGNVLAGNNYFRVSMATRNPALVNHISSNVALGDVAATTRVLTGSATIHNTPNVLPAAAVGGPRLLGSNFVAQYVPEGGAPTGAHLAAGVSDHRGALGYTPANFPAIFPGATSGTAGILGQGAGGTRTLNVFGLAGTAQVAPLALTLPSGALVDNADGFTVNPAGSVAFSHYYNATAFRGGVAQIALGSDKQGRLLAAATANHPANAATAGKSEKNAIAVARRDSAGSTAWTIAAYTTATGGKAIHDATGTTVVGNLVPWSMLTGGAPDNGPSISPPSFDSLGNVYFTASHVLTTPPGGIEVGLFRARLDSTTFAYKLELLVREGDEFHGNNSDTDWRINFLPLVDGAGFSSPAAHFSTAATSGTYNGLTAGTIADGSPMALGGIVIGAEIVYDVNDDGIYAGDTEPSSMLGGPDEEYQVLLFIQPAEDCNENGVADDLDIADGTSQDLDLDGVPDDCSGFDTFCNGDGGAQPGCTPCPCGNDAPGGTLGGCLNSALRSARLLASGNPNVGADTLRFEMTGGTSLSFGVLTSGTSRLPNNIANPCFGLDSGVQSAFFDGLRCVGGGTLRHGSRAIDANGDIGLANAGWGPPNGPAGGLIAANGFSAGQTRHFQVVYRENPALGCLTAQNTSQGVSVTFQP